MTVLDYSGSRPSPRAMRDAGVVGVMRYLTSSTKSSKMLDASEIPALHDEGLGLGVVWETTANRVLGGGAAGSADGWRSGRMADDFGFPAPVPVFSAVDFDVTSQMVTVRAYFDAFEQASQRPAGAYGEADVIDALVPTGVVGFGWQTAAWSRRRKSAHNALYQKIGGTLARRFGADENDLLDARVLWWPGTPPTITPTPTTTGELTVAQIDDLLARLEDVEGKLDKIGAAVLVDIASGADDATLEDLAPLAELLARVRRMHAKNFAGGDLTFLDTRLRNEADRILRSIPGATVPTS